jgi:DNA mismatch repair protein MutH
VATKVTSLPINLSKIKNEEDLVNTSKWLEEKTLRQITKGIRDTDTRSRVLTKGDVGYVVEEGFFGIRKNSISGADIHALGIEIKTNPLKYNKTRTLLCVKEPLSLNIINYFDEVKTKDIRDSVLYKKNRKILFILYVHDKLLNRSEYLIKYVFLWKMDNKVLNELRPDYKLIVDKIKRGEAHKIHQYEHKYLTICPKHNGKFKDPKDMSSKRPQPFNRKPAEIRAFRLKNRYMNLIISRTLGKKLEKKGGWTI